MRKTSLLAGLSLTLALAGSALTGCTAHDDGPEVDRWWSNGVNDAGSVIHSGDADEIAPDEDLYCDMLTATTDAGESIFPEDIDPSDEAYVRTIEAFFDEVTALAPGDLGDDWATVYTVVEALVEAQGDPAQLADADIDAAAVQEASQRITDHAVASCGLTL